jgi:hypothetical protein
MTKDITYKISFIMLIYLLAPYGFGIAGVGFLKTIDGPKIFPLLACLIIGYKFNFNKIDRVTLFFLLFAFLHFLSIFYSPNFESSLKEGFGAIFLFYPGYFLGYLSIKNEESIVNLIVKLRWVFVLLCIFSIIEFIFQFNFYNLFRNVYDNQINRFNQNLGLIRLGLKASMGPFASTLPFAYLLVSLFFLKDILVKKSKIKSGLLDIIGLLAIMFTLCRAALVTVVFLLIIKYILVSKFSNKVRGIFFIVFSLAVITLQVQKTEYASYIDNYILNIFDDSSKTSVSLRQDNNRTDFNFAMNSPIIGHGAGQLYQAKTGNSRDRLDSSDSSYLLTILSDRGLISVILFLAVLFIVIKQLYSLEQKLVGNKFNVRSLIYSILALFLCLNASQRVEVLFFLFFIIGFSNKLYKLFKNHVDFSNSPHLQ